MSFEFEDGIKSLPPLKDATDIDIVIKRPGGTVTTVKGHWLKNLQETFGQYEERTGKNP